MLEIIYIPMYPCLHDIFQWELLHKFLIDGRAYNSKDGSEPNTEFFLSFSS